MIPDILEVTARDVSAATCVLTAVGEIDHDSRHHLNHAVDDALRRDRVQVVLDLTAVTFCDSGGLSTFVDAHRQATARGGWLRLAGPGAHVLDALQATNLDRYLTVCATVDEATGAGPRQS